MSGNKSPFDLDKLEKVINKPITNINQKIKNLEEFLTQKTEDAFNKTKEIASNIKESGTERFAAITQGGSKVIEDSARLAKFEKTRLAMRYWLMGRNYNKAAEAMEYAAQYHSGTRRDGITPEFAHQIAIAHFIRTLHNLDYPEETLITAFLHDIVEDYNVSLDEIESKFGSKVKQSVKLISKMINGHQYSPEDYFHAMSANPMTSIVKGADRIHNFQTMVDVFTPQKQVEYIEECETFILPMLKKAKRNFPTQETAYENLKHVLNSQIELIKITLKSK